MIILGILAVFIAIILIDLPLLLKAQQQRKTVIIYSLIILLSSTVSIFQVIYDSNLLTPANVIENIIDFIIR